MWRGEHCQTVERAFGADLLHDADGGVQHEHEPEERVLEGADDDDGGEEGTEDGVEPGEDIRSQDVGDRPRRREVLLVAQPALAPCLDLCCRQSSELASARNRHPFIMAGNRRRCAPC